MISVTGLGAARRDDAVSLNLDNLSYNLDKFRNKLDNANVRTPQDRHGQKIRQFILEQVDEHPHDITHLTAKNFSLTRQAINIHLQRLVAERQLVRRGKTRKTRFFLAPTKTWQKRYHAQEQNESDVWETDVLPQLSALPENALDIWRYCFTEMFNNAIDHSSGNRITVQLNRTAVNVQITIIDNGVGIFKKIQKAMKFADVRYATLELAKGKFTTDPARHTGEGIFFTSKMLDGFDISSGGVYFTSESQIKITKGTAIWMKLENAADRSRQKIYDNFASPENDYAFDKTIVPVKMAEHSKGDLVSRSQAKRLLLRIDRFRTVVFDFENVEQIGQAFADEIFRVFARRHPGVELQFANANKQITNMIRRARNAQP